MENGVESFGDRLRRLRTERGLSLSELGYMVGVSEGAIRQMESGQTKSASFQVGIKLAKVLGVDAGYLALGDRAGNLTERVAGLEDRQRRSAEEVDRTIGVLLESLLLLARFLEAHGVLTPPERERLQRLLAAEP